MQILTTGHKYELQNFDDAASPGQTLQFIEKRPSINPNDAGELELVNDGTTNEEVLAVLVDRLNYLNGKFPCRENSLAITKIQEALFWLNFRTSNRTARGVEGKHLK